MSNNFIYRKGQETNEYPPWKDCKVCKWRDHEVWTECPCCDTFYCRLCHLVYKENPDGDTESIKNIQSILDSLKRKFSDKE